MKKASFSSVLRFTAMISLALAAYPIIAVKNCISEFVQPEVNLYELMVVLTLVCAGYFIGAATDSFQMSRPFLHLMMSLLIFTVTAVLTGVFCYLSGYAFGTLLYLDAIAAGGTVVAAIYIYYSDYSQILTFSKVSIISVIFVISCLVVFLSECPYSISHYAILLLSIYSAFGLITNQKHIDDIMNRRHHSFDSLPKKIRYFNIRLLIFMFSVIVVLFLFRKQLAALIKSAIAAIIYVILFLFQLINKLITLLTSSDTPVEIPEETQEPLPPPEDSPDLMPLFLLIIFAIVVYFIVKRRKKIVRALRSAWTKVKRFVAKLLNLKFTRKPDKATDGYTDTEEYLVADSHRRRRRPQNLWRKSYRAYLKMPRDSAAYRFGYGLLVSAIAKHYLVRESMTPIEICAAIKSSPVLSINLPTQVYNAIRYGEQDYNGSFDELNSALEAVRKFG